MGYRSDVTFVVPEHAPRFEKLYPIEFDTILELDGYRLYERESVKWYDDSPEESEEFAGMAKIRAFILDHEDVCKFIRIGEDLEDIEMLGQLLVNDDPFHLILCRESYYSSKPIECFHCDFLGHEHLITLIELVNVLDMAKEVDRVKFDKLYIKWYNKLSGYRDTYCKEHSDKYFACERCIFREDCEF